MDKTYEYRNFQGKLLTTDDYSEKKLFAETNS